MYMLKSEANRRGNLTKQDDECSAFSNKLATNLVLLLSLLGAQSNPQIMPLSGHHLPGISCLMKLFSPIFLTNLGSLSRLFEICTSKVITSVEG